MRNRLQSDPDQGELGLAQIQPDRQVSPDDLDAVLRILIGKGWMTAEDIAATLGEGWNDRKVRAVCSAAVPGIVSSPGKKGYKVWADCSVTEIDQAISAIESQANEMTKRAFLYRRAYHERFRG